MKKITFILSLIFCLFSFPYLALAHYTNFYYDSSNDYYRIDLASSGWASVRNVHKNTRGEVTQDQVYTSDQAAWIYYECNGTVTLTFYDASGSVIDTHSFTLTEVQSEKASCYPNGTGDDGGSSPPSDATNQDIVNALGQIKQVLQQNGMKLDGISSKLSSINSNLGEILDQLTATVAPSYPSSPQAPDLDDNKPPMPDTPFEDDNTYFSDQGDASSPGAFPAAPEPDECWENGTICRDPASSRDSLNTRDAPLERDAPPSKDDVSTRDAPLKRDAPPSKDDVPTRDAPLERDVPPSKDDVPTRDVPPDRDAPPSKDDVPTRDAPPDRDAPPSKDDVPTRDAPPDRDPVDYGFPDWTN